MVYLVVYGLYYETQIDAVFKTKKAAKERVKQLKQQFKNNDNYSGADILERELK